MHSENCTILICPGGAYRFLSPRESNPVAEAFESRGFRAEICSYSIRSSEEQLPLMLQPVKELGKRLEAIRSEREGPVVVCGFSAGGHLAATLGVHWRTLELPRPDALILCYPVITAKEAYINEESFRNLADGKESRDFFSLEKHVSDDVPPVFLWHTAADRSVPVENTLLFASALSAHKVPFEAHIYPFGEHGLSLATEEVSEKEKGRLPDRHVAGWIDECAAWLRQIL